jgi:hypothetical protein
MSMPPFISHSMPLFQSKFQSQPSQSQPSQSKQRQSELGRLDLLASAIAIPDQTVSAKTIPAKTIPARSIQTRFDEYDDPTISAPEELLQDADSPPPDREAVRLLVIGSRQSVTTIVQTLYHLGFAEMSEWSPFLPGPNPGEVMRILTRYLLATA